MPSLFIDTGYQLTEEVARLVNGVDGLLEDFVGH